MTEGCTCYLGNPDDPMADEEACAACDRAFWARPVFRIEDEPDQVATWNPITVFEFVQPAKPITMNQRSHWAKKAGQTKAWRNAAHIAAVGASRGRGPKARAAGPRDVVVRFDVTGVRRRDPHNWHPTVKAIVDGLVDAGLWPDDTPEHVRVLEPVLTPVPVPRRGEPLRRLTCTVELVPRKA